MTDSTAGPRAPAGKSEAAFRTISEVAEELDVPQHVLRFWETKFTQIRPMKRGGGRRYYRPEDVALLQRIRALLYDDGLTIKGVQKLLREKGVKALIGDPQPLPATLAEVEAAAGANQAEPPAAADDRSPKLPFEDAAAAPEAAVSGLSTRQRQEIETALAELVALRDELAAELRRQEAA